MTSRATTTQQHSPSPTASPSYCAACTRLLTSPPLSTPTTHHPSGLSLEQSAMTGPDGCTFCFALWDMLTGQEQEWIRHQSQRPMRGFGKGLTSQSQANADPANSANWNIATSYFIEAPGKIWLESFDMTYTFLEMRWKDDEFKVEKKVVFIKEGAMAKLLPKNAGISSANLFGAVELARQWMMHCEQTHGDSCIGRETQESKTFMPNRLIDVGDATNSTIRLHITTDKNTFEKEGNSKSLSRYMTLSHCWGKLHFKTLTTENIDSMRRNIDWSSLTKTFQDAIQVTRALGVRFIWIDSLCIIQNNVDDWFVESRLMGDIYTNSFCNISAAAAIDGSVGCFPSECDPRSSIPLRAPVDWPSTTSSLSSMLISSESKHTDQASSTITGRETNTESYILVDPILWSREIDSSPLHTRAWVFQERFLCPRNLLFGSKRLFWECDHPKGFRACETFPGGIPDAIESVEFKVSAGDALRKLFPPSGGQGKGPDQKIGENGKEVEAGGKEAEGEQVEKETNSHAVRVYLALVTGAQSNPIFEGTFPDNKNEDPNIYRQWFTIVSHYSKGLLTKESDRLIALYGVAQWMKTHLISSNHEYIAGMWRGPRLVNQLLWSTYPKLKKRRTKRYCAPSWSWASIIGRVSFRDILEAETQGMEKVAVVEDVKIWGFDGKPGQVERGILRLRTRVFAGTWKTWGLEFEALKNLISILNGEASDNKEDKEGDEKKGERDEEETEISIWESQWSDTPVENYMFQWQGKDVSLITGCPDVEEEDFKGKEETVCVVTQMMDKRHEREKQYDSWELIVEGLVVKKVEGNSEKFQRIGYFSAHGKGAAFCLEKATEKVIEII